jgi:hypothetical protein
MSTVLRIGPFRLFFYSNEGNEPPHIHIESGDNLAKFWLEPVACAENTGFTAKELGTIARIVDEHHTTCLERWHDYHGR